MCKKQVMNGWPLLLRSSFDILIPVCNKSSLAWSIICYSVDQWTRTIDVVNENGNSDNNNDYNDNYNRKTFTTGTEKGDGRNQNPSARENLDGDASDTGRRDDGTGSEKRRRQDGKHESGTRQTRKGSRRRETGNGGRCWKEGAAVGGEGGG